MKLNQLTLITFAFLLLVSFTPNVQEFQGQAYYFSKSTMELGDFGARMSEAQKKSIQERLKNRLEKTFVLNFNKEESLFQEEDKLDAVSGDDPRLSTKALGKQIVTSFVKNGSIIIEELKQKYL